MSAEPRAGNCGSVSESPTEAGPGSAQAASVRTISRRRMPWVRRPWAGGYMSARAPGGIFRYGTSVHVTAVWKLLKVGFLLGLFFAAVGAAALAGMFWVYGSDPNLPHILQLKDYHAKQTTRILAADGKVIGELYE